MSLRNSDPERGAYDDADVVPLDLVKAKKVHGSVRLYLPADDLREIGIEPKEMVHGDEIEFYLGMGTDVSGRLVLDRRG